MRKIVLSKKELKIKLALIFVLAVILAVTAIFFSAPIDKLLHIGKTGKSGKYVSSEIVETGDMVVHYIDVGQGDATLIELPDNTTMLIDAGDTDAKDAVVNYIKALNITTINYFVITHSDSDHIGGACEVFDKFDVENIYRPFAIYGTAKKIIDPKTKKETESTVLEDFTASPIDDLSKTFNKLKSENLTLINDLPRITSTVYKNTITSMYAEKYINELNSEVYSNVCVNYDNLKISSTDASKNFEIEFYAPLKSNSNYSLVSDYSPRTTGYLTKGYGATTATGKNAISPLIRVEYLNKKFVFTGDMYEKAEKEVVNSLTPAERSDLSNVTVYQAGHHGASNASTKELLSLLNPTYTVVSVGKNNRYKHPAEEFLKRVDNLDHSISDYLLRTDKQGNIAFAVFKDGQVKYSANIELVNTAFELQWWQIAVGIFVVGSVIILSIRFYQRKPKKNKR